jgi:indoleamine 2,3-dioxygenase
LYNWTHKISSEAAVPTPNDLRFQTLFSGLTDEEEFYLCSARIELRGVELLELMRATMDETFVGDAIAVRRITDYIQQMASVIKQLKALLLDVRKNCDPETYYGEIRPWFRGEDADIQKREWVFEGLGEYPELQRPKELSGPSAGQSSLIHVLDIFLGVDNRSPSSSGKPSFLARMQSYMPRDHRLFLNHLSLNPRPLRQFVLSADDPRLLQVYNATVLALKEFRDAHMIIATLYIVGPARRAAKALRKDGEDTWGSFEHKPPMGTGGTDLVKFLKDVRNRTTEMLIPGP